MTVTPLSVVTTFPGWVRSQLPPPPAAKSTITLPGVILATMADVISLGDGLPGIIAVVIIISTSLACSAKSAISASIKALLMTLA